MKPLIIKLAIVGIVSFVVLPASWSGEFNYASYTQTTIQDIIATEERNCSQNQLETKKHEDCVQLECRVSKYRVPCCYVNIRRPLSEKKKNLIKMWMGVLKIDPDLGSLYQQEIQVTEGLRVYWIPIQEQLFPFINKELVKNDTIRLFIILIGKIDSEYVFIATEFEKSFSPAKNSAQATASTRAAP